VWGISLDVLVKQNKTKQVPFIVEKIIQHVEQYGTVFPLLETVIYFVIMIAGLDQEGLYRVNGNARMIEKLKASFDKGWCSMCTISTY